MNALDTALDYASAYVRRGFAVLPVPFKTKRPILNGWQQLRLTEDALPQHFSGKVNIGLLTGEPSSWLVDVDCDAWEAIEVAPDLLPSTPMVHGHGDVERGRSKPRSHYWYRSQVATKKYQFAELDANLARAKPTMFVELRSTGCQTLVPPSLHTSGERLYWDRLWGADDILSEPSLVPAELTPADLGRAVAKVAAASLLARYWPGTGSRDDTALALCGMLVRAGWSDEEIDHFVRLIAQTAGDEQWRQRGKARHSREQLAAGKPITGAPKLAELLRDGQHVLASVREWLALAHAAEQPHKHESTGQREGDAAAEQTWQPTVQSAADLLRKVLPPVRWAVEGLLPEGVNLLAAKAKKGKSTLMLHMACAIADGVPVMGHFATTRSDVLYLALEDNERRMQKRLRNMLQGEPAPKSLHFAYEWLPLDMGGDTALEAYLDAHPDIHVVVVDTLEHIRPKRRSPTGSYSDDYTSVRGLQQMAGRRQLCVVAISHLRKAPAEDPFDEINATMGLLASIDNALVMRSANGLTELHRRGRDFEDITVLALKGDTQTLLWRVEGTAEEVTRSAGASNASSEQPKTLHAGQRI